MRHYDTRNVRTELPCHNGAHSPPSSSCSIAGAEVEPLKLLNVLGVIQKSAEYLAKRGVDSPRLQAELILAHILSVPRLQLYLDYSRQLTTGEMDRARELVRRRGTREPLQHLLQSTSFCGFDIEVNRSVLVPRPETEILAEKAWQFLKKNFAGGGKVLDFGTGSGCIAIAIANHSPEAQILAIDISKEALQLARTNAEKNKVAEKITFLQSDRFTAIPPESKFDLIVSNPPYISKEEIPSLMPEVREFDPILALDGGDDGLIFYRYLVKEAALRLNDGGKLMMEFGDGQSLTLQHLFGKDGWKVDSVLEDYTGRSRVLVASRR